MDYYQIIQRHIQQQMNPTAVSDLACNLLVSVYRDHRIPNNKYILPNITAGDIRSARVWESAPFIATLLTLVRHRLVRMIRDEVAHGFTMTTQELFQLSDDIEQYTAGAEKIVVAKMTAWDLLRQGNHKIRTLEVQPG